MRTLKHLTLAIFLMVAASLQVNAQQRNHKGNAQGKQQVEALKQKLNLTDEQTEKIKTIMANHRKAMREQQQANPEADKQERAKAMKARMQELDEQILAVLNADQQQIYNKEKQARKEEMKEKRKEKGRGRGN